MSGENQKTDPGGPPRKKWSSGEFGNVFGGNSPYVWLLAVVLGSAGSGGVGSMLGGQQTAEDLARLEEKMDRLDEKMTKIRILIAEHHGGARELDRP